jgi:hypothetical protein
MGLTACKPCPSFDSCAKFNCCVQSQHNHQDKSVVYTMPEELSNLFIDFLKVQFGEDQASKIIREISPPNSQSDLR